MVDTLVTNFTTALDAVSSAGANVVVSTAPDIGSVPATRATYPDAARRQRITDAVNAANAQIAEIALSRGMPVVDFAALVNRYYSPASVFVGGVDVKLSGRFFLGDGVHPSTLVQGLVGNAFIAAANDVYRTNFTPLSGEEILANAGISGPQGGGETFDAHSLVMLPAVIEPGDYNGDSVVDAADYGVWRGQFGLTVAAYSGADANGDTVVDTADYVAWRNNFGSPASATSTAVPEPAAATHALLAISLVFRRRTANNGRCTSDKL
jgi:hypothetical protein